MRRFDVTILGSGSALPTRGRNPSAQLVVVHNRHFLMDCGEGTQLRLRENRVKIQSITHIFISHLHGDHYLGLMGLLSSFNLLGRTKELTIIGPDGLKEMVDLHLKLASSAFQYTVHYVVTDSGSVNVVYDSPQVEVISFPLDHRIPTTGFLFKEKNLEWNIKKSAIAEYGIGVKDINAIKKGADLILDSGEIIPNERLTKGVPVPRSYAYCSDTKYKPDLAEMLTNVDLIYHEATFVQEDEERAKKTKHSTSTQAALTARDAGAGALLLGHFSARYESTEVILAEAKEIFENSIVVEEGTCYEVRNSS